MSSADDKVQVVDILSEFFEIAVHNIIYVRNLYPDAIFVPKKKYGVTVYQAIHPGVRDYIRDCLKAVVFYCRKKQLKRLFVSFEHEDTILEKFVFDVLEITELCERDVFMVELEQSLRNFILRLHSSQIYLSDLAPEATFSIQLQTSFSSNLEFNEDPLYEDFPWIEQTPSDGVSEESVSIVPIHTVETEFLKLQINKIMDGSEEGVKTKTLAVFQNVVTKEKQNKRKKFRPHRFSDEDSSPSESELVIDDEAKEEVTKRKRSGVRIRFKEEILNMQCQWDDCSKVFQECESMYKHLVEHVSDIIDNFDCKWTKCPNPSNILTTQMLIRHLAYHGYLAKLINLGENVVERNNLPNCNLEPIYTIEINDDGYTCQWEGCNFAFNTIFEFFGHIECHANGAPSGKEVEVVEVIPCLWSGCGSKFSTRYKLADHFKVHTKERVIACPKCVSLFSNKTNFCDHRKRQLKTHLRSYQCSQCLKLFSSERILSDHMRSHINQYKCTLCDMTSTKPSMLAKHYRFRHMNVRPFSCHQCDKTFVTKSNLNTHVLTHQEKPFKCDQCDFGCKSKVGLGNHVLKVHGIEKPFYECQVCKILFRRGDYLTKHLIKFHKFHWPSGHSRFRYRKDSDGVCRLQTVRYESLEVTEEMIKSETMKPLKNSSAVTYNVTYDKNEANGYKLTVLQDSDLNHTENTEKIKNTKEKELDQEIIISIEDLDEKGNVIQRQEIGSGDFFLLSPGGSSVPDSNDNLTDNTDSGKGKISSFEAVSVKENPLDVL